MSRDVRLAEKLMREARDDPRLRAEPNGLERFLEERSHRLTAKLADQLAELAKRALMGQAWPMATMAAGLGTSVNLRLGRRLQAVATQFILAQGVYQQATTPEDYEVVRRMLVEVVRQAETIGDARHAFEARGVMIQSGYFATKAASNPSVFVQDAAQACLRRALGDLVELLESQPASMPAEDVVFVMESAFAPLDLATSEFHSDQDAMDALLRKVAAAIDVHIPPDARYSEDAERDAAIANVLARLPDSAAS